MAEMAEEFNPVIRGEDHTSTNLVDWSHIIPVKELPDNTKPQLLWISTAALAEIDITCSEHNFIINIDVPHYFKGKV